MMLISNVISGVCNMRHWVATWSKRMTCQCGCFGRCTFDSVFRCIVWMGTAWMTKTDPTVRGDGTPFSESTRIGDALRALKGKAKQAMRTRGRSCRNMVTGHGTNSSSILSVGKLEDPCKGCVLNAWQTPVSIRSRIRRSTLCGEELSLRTNASCKCAY